MARFHAPPPGSLRSAACIAAAGLILVMLPAIALTATFGWVHAADRCRPLPLVLRSSLAPDDGTRLVKLEMPEDAGR